MKTAIEQLMEDLDAMLFGDLNITTKEIWEKAKELEKQQIIEAHGDKLIKPKSLDADYWRTGEEYYNKKFK